MGKRGRKICPNCNTEIGIRTKLCDCGWYFPTKEMRKDLLEVKIKSKEIKIFTEGGAGRKTCPGCKVIIGAVIKICPKCQLDFSTIIKEIVPKKEKVTKEVKEEKVLSLKQQESNKEMLDALRRCEEIPKLTPKEHAKRILSYGKERASSLLFMARTKKYWDHVDWEIVEKGLL